MEQYCLYMFFNLLFTSTHLRPLQVANCDSNSRLVVDEDYNGNSGLKRLNKCNSLTIWAIATGFSVIW